MLNVWSIYNTFVYSIFASYTQRHVIFHHWNVRPHSCPPNFETSKCDPRDGKQVGHLRSICGVVNAQR